MINIWNYNYGDNIKIICTDDIIFEGMASDIADSSECSDLEKQEDSICIITADNKHIVIYQSEIKNIIKLSEKSALKKVGNPI